MEMSFSPQFCICSLFKISILKSSRAIKLSIRRYYLGSWKNQLIIKSLYVVPFNQLTATGVNISCYFLIQKSRNILNTPHTVKVDITTGTILFPQKCGMMLRIMVMMMTMMKTIWTGAVKQETSQRNIMLIVKAR